MRECVELDSKGLGYVQTGLMRLLLALRLLSLCAPSGIAGGMSGG